MKEISKQYTLISQREFSPLLYIFSLYKVLSLGLLRSPDL